MLCLSLSHIISQTFRLQAKEWAKVFSVRSGRGGGFMVRAVGRDGQILNGGIPLPSNLLVYLKSVPLLLSLAYSRPQQKFENSVKSLDYQE